MYPVLFLPSHPPHSPPSSPVTIRPASRRRAAEEISDSHPDYFSWQADQPSQPDLPVLESKKINKEISSRKCSPSGEELLLQPEGGEEWCLLRIPGPGCLGMGGTAAKATGMWWCGGVRRGSWQECNLCTGFLGREVRCSYVGIFIRVEYLPYILLDE